MTDVEIPGELLTLSTLRARAGRRFIESETYLKARASGREAMAHELVAAGPVPVLDQPELRAALGLVSFDIEGIPVTADLPSAALLPGMVETIPFEKLQAELAPELSETVLATAVPVGTSLPEGQVNYGLTPTLQLLPRFGVAFPVTVGQLDEPGYVESIINRRMEAGVGLGLENDLINGNDSWTGILALLAAGGETVAKTGGQYRVDAIVQAAGVVHNAGWYQRPLAVVCNPITRTAVLTERDGNTQPLPVIHMLRGLVDTWIPSRWMPPGTAVVGDFFSAVALLVHGGLEIGVSPNYLDFLSRGMVEMALEFRCFGWVRELGPMCSVTGIS
jgi:hypothetical protein